MDPRLRQQVALERRGRETLGFCPDCQGAVRRLYAPARRRALRLSGLPRARLPAPLATPAEEQALSELREAMGPLLEAALVVDGLLDDLPGERCVPDAAAWTSCLPLSKRSVPSSITSCASGVCGCEARGSRCGPSPAAPAVSKSSVARYLAPGLAGIDRVELHRERFARAADAATRWTGCSVRCGPAARPCPRQQAARTL